MKTTSILLSIALISPAFAGKPGQLCNPNRSTHSGKLSRNSIDAILNDSKNDTRTNSDFIALPIPGIPIATNTTASDKSQYSLFNPTPDSLLRDLSPDRPDATESPLTVDAGRFALEASLFDWRRDGGADSYTYGSLNFKAGLSQNTDLQTIINLHSGGDDFTDLTFRLKWNIWGNDGGDSSLAIMPFVKVPTRGSDEWEGGLIVPWGTDLADGIGLGLMGELDYVHNGTDYEFEFLHTAVLGFDLTDKLGAYTEYIGILGEDAYQAFLAGGMSYAVNDHLILDFGAQVGLNSDSEDFGFFTGFTKRF